MMIEERGIEAGRVIYRKDVVGDDGMTSAKIIPLYIDHSSP
jgi:hypothetical protein